MNVENYVGRCPECGVITAASRMPMTAKEIGRFAEDMANTNRVLDTATNAELKAATWEHRHNCQHRAPKVARQLKLEDRK